MTVTQAKAEVFLTAFRALSKPEQSAILAGLIHNSHLREDIIDLAIAETRSNEDSRSLKSFLQEIHKAHRAQ